jgi:hypothetical protein
VRRGWPKRTWTTGRPHSSAYSPRRRRDPAGRPRPPRPSPGSSPWRPAHAPAHCIRVHIRPGAPTGHRRHRPWARSRPPPRRVWQRAAAETDRRRRRGRARSPAARAPRAGRRWRAAARSRKLRPRRPCPPRSSTAQPPAPARSRSRPAGGGILRRRRGSWRRPRRPHHVAAIVVDRASGRGPQAAAGP